jgi:hypothetical protein
VKASAVWPAASSATASTHSTARRPIGPAVTRFFACATPRTFNSTRRSTWSTLARAVREHTARSPHQNTAPAPCWAPAPGARLRAPDRAPPRGRSRNRSRGYASPGSLRTASPPGARWRERARASATHHPGPFSSGPRCAPGTSVPCSWF